MFYKDQTDVSKRLKFSRDCDEEHCRKNLNLPLIEIPGFNEKSISSENQIYIQYLKKLKKSIKSPKNEAHKLHNTHQDKYDLVNN